MDNATVMRRGVVGALIDEYERALEEYLTLTDSLDEEQFAARWTTAGRFSAIADIVNHTYLAGYGYADIIRQARNSPVTSPKTEIIAATTIRRDHQAMFAYTLDSVDGLYDLTEEEVYAMQLQVWNDDTYHLEQLLEHAIVHILRHRRQLEQLLEGIYS